MLGAAQNVPDLPRVAPNGYRTKAAVMALEEHKAVGGIPGSKSGQNLAEVLEVQIALRQVGLTKIRKK